MNTPTHVLINWTVAKWIARDSFPRVAVILGSIAPDISLYVLSLGGAAWFHWAEGQPWPEVARHMYGHLFYHDPWWITLHNFLHSPLMLLACLQLVLLRVGRRAFWGSWWAWFFLSCLLHTAVDIPVHHDDGPLVFWPLNWNYRFASPLSYWDRRHYAAIVMPIEAIIFLTLLANLMYRRLRPR